MKKQNLLAAVLAVVMAFSTTLATGLSVWADSGNEELFPAYISGTVNWTNVYLPIKENRTADDVKTDITVGSDYTARNAEVDANMRMYINAGDLAGRHVATGDAYDIGMMFTAPAAGTYRLDFTGKSVGYLGTDASDGVRVMVYKNTFDTPIKNELATDTDLTISEQIEMVKGDKLYVLFNKNKTNYSDYCSISKFEIALPVSTIVFPAATAPEAAVVSGTTFSHLLNLKNNADIKALWKTFFIEGGAVKDLALSADGNMNVLPEGYNTGGNQWAYIWEGLNAVMPADTYIMGEYFMVPADGKVKVECNFAYETGPEINPNADGVGVTVYKNNLGTVAVERELFNYENSKSGKAWTSNDIEVKAGDKLIFVYDKNVSLDNDSLRVTQQQVVYTEAAEPTNLFTPDETVVKITDGKIKALKTLTIAQLFEKLGINGLCNGAAAMNADGIPMIDTSWTIDKISTITLYTQGQIVASYPIEAVDSFSENTSDNKDDNKPNDTNKDDTTDQIDEKPVKTGMEGMALILLTAIVSFAAIICFRKKREN